MKGYPKWFTAGVVTLLLGILYFSGIFLAPTTLENNLEVNMPWRLSAGTRTAVAALHVFFAFLIMGVLGALWSIHMRSEWRKGGNRNSAVAMLVLFSCLIITGIGIYYIGENSLASWFSLIHLATGVLLASPYLWHICKRL